jgi:MoxR-like ATPase
VELDQFAQKYNRTVSEVSKVVLGQESIVEHVLIALLSGGHVLLEGVPGLGKTLLVRSLGAVLGCSFGRVQFTPDLMPSDVTGGNVYSAQSSAFEFIPGPIFTQLVLADEINRAPAKTQSSLLEAMQERAVTVDGVTRQLPSPFLVLATQNPIESQGTYPLPEAQLDRFLMKVHVDYPEEEVERSLLLAYVNGFDPQHLQLERVLSAAELLEMQGAISQVKVSPSIVEYITSLVRATRDHRNIDVGASPRASVGLLQTARAHAATRTRDFLIPDDVKSFAHAVLRHRIVLHPDAELDGVTADDVISGILAETSVPGGVS